MSVCARTVPYIALSEWLSEARGERRREVAIASALGSRASSWFVGWWVSRWVGLEWVSPCVLGWPWPQSHVPVSASRVLGWQEWPTPICVTISPWHRAAATHFCFFPPLSIKRLWPSTELERGGNLFFLTEHSQTFTWVAKWWLPGFINICDV